jgi:signal transduction histidine kinase
MPGAYGPYIVTEAFCIAFSLILLSRLKYGLGSGREIQTLRILFVWFFVLLITDMLWAMNEDNYLLPPKIVNGAISAASFSAVSWGCFYWYRFVAERSGRYSRIGKTEKVLLALPTMAITALLIASVFTGWLFYIDGEDHYRDTPLMYLRVGVNYFYLLLASGYAVWGAFRSGSRQKRLEYLGYVVYVLASVAVFFAEDEFPQSPLAALYIFLALLILYLTIYVDRETEILKQQEELTRSRVDIMRSQIQPHFLYNALSVIVYYCDSDPQLAKQTTLVFSNYLRENLNSLATADAVPFEQELAHVKNYLYLEKLRFEDRLNVTYDIQTTDFRLPFISVQPLVENAVRHGVGARKSGGSVAISTQELADCYEVAVSDNCSGFEQSDDDDPHRGIKNIRRRVEEISGGTLSIKSETGSGTVATIRIPKERKQK